METIQFECKKVALKQDKNGYMLTVLIHPDDVPEPLLRDFVGSDYQAVLVRLDNQSQPMNREDEFAGDRAIRIAGLLCRDPNFWEYLFSKSEISTKDYESATQWLRFYLELESRSQLKSNTEAQNKLDILHRDFNRWKPKS
jgi:hypothetical protein